MPLNANNPFRSEKTEKPGTSQPSASSAASSSSSAPPLPADPPTGSSALAESHPQLPAEQDIPDEAPPPYSPPTAGSEAAIFTPQFSNTGGHSSRPSQSSPAASSAHYAPPPHPPANRPGQKGDRHRPPPGPPPGPPHGPPTGHIPQHSNYGAPSQYPMGYGPPSQYPSRPRLPWVYPPRYWCVRCHNTGTKLSSGRSCTDCFRRFARQPPNVPIMAPSGGMFGFGNFLQERSSFSVLLPGSSRAITVRAGDPRLGGMQCGGCRGEGQIYDLLGGEVCPCCRGLGRLFV